MLIAEAEPKMDDDGLGLKTVLSNCDAKRDHNYRLGADNFTITTREYAVLCEALAALESRSEVLEEPWQRTRREVLIEAAMLCRNMSYEHRGPLYENAAENVRNYHNGCAKGADLCEQKIRDLASRAEPGAPSELGRDDDCVRRDFERGVIERAEREPNAAEQASPSVAPAESNSEFAAGPASAAPEVDPQVFDQAHGLRDDWRNPWPAAAPDVKEMMEDLPKFRCTTVRFVGKPETARGTMEPTEIGEWVRRADVAALLESAHARVDSWPAFTSFYNQGLEEAAKVCEECRVLIIGDPIEQGAVMIARETGHDLARQIRAKIKPTRGEE